MGERNEGRVKLKVRSGAASFVVTAILTIVIIGVITSLAIVTSRQVRQATDLDQSSRALNAAQAGIEAYGVKVAKDPSYERTSCTDGTEPNISDNVDPAQNIAIVCALVLHEGETFSGFLERDQGMTFRLNTARIGTTNWGVGTMNFNWNLLSSDSPNSDYPGTDNPNTHPKHNNNPSDYPTDYPKLLDPAVNRDEPATIEFTFSWCPKYTSDRTECNYNSGGFLNDSSNKNPGIGTKTVVIRPWNSSSGLTSDCRAPNNNLIIYACHVPAAVATPTAIGNCAAGEKKCLLPQDLAKVFVGNIPGIVGDGSLSDAAILQGYNLTLTVRARYSSTHFSVNFGARDSSFPSTGQGVVWDWPQAQIDITARSGEIYRRLIGNKTIQFGVNDTLAYALFSGKNICKNVIAYNDGVGQINTPGCEP